MCFLYIRMNLAIKKAKETGIGWVTAKGSNHFGICQWYTAMATRWFSVGLCKYKLGYKSHDLL